MPNIGQSYQSTKPTNKKRLILVLCVLVFLHLSEQTTPKAQAGVFDSLLKILLPFYDNDRKALSDDRQDEEPAIPDESDQFNTPDEMGEFTNVDTDDNPLNAKTSNMADIIFDDALNAHDSTPMLGYPDLYALLSAEFGVDRGRWRCPLSTKPPNNRLPLLGRGNDKTLNTSLHGSMSPILP